MPINLHSFLERSSENGPGTRAVLWVQGCNLDCPGCFNPDIHSMEPRILIPVKELAENILRISGIDGITVSGGEPFLQAGALAEFGGLLQSYDLGVIVFTGFTFEQISQANRSDWNALLACTDLLIDGPFLQSLPCHLPLRGSSNQELHFLTDRYKRFQEELQTGTNSVEVLINSTGDIIITGFPGHDLL